MNEPASIPRRIGTIKALAREYFDMEYGELIERPLELLRIFDIRGSRHEKHPRKGTRVYISRKSLKHFVEERKVDLMKRHPEEEVFGRILFALEHLQETITDYELYEEDRTRTPVGHFYTKDYSAKDYPQLRILLDEKHDSAEICSIHFKTARNK
ncbi:MAG: hypothetical protein JWM39_549 [Parcubacteria group bacterium]|nr:hypothetical protein [Parcubacteria group bacterium]